MEPARSVALGQRAQSLFGAAAGVPLAAGALSPLAVAGAAACGLAVAAAALALAVADWAAPVVVRLCSRGGGAPYAGTGQPASSMVVPTATATLATFGAPFSHFWYFLALVLLIVRVFCLIFVA